MQRERAYNISGAIRQGQLEAQHGVVMLLVYDGAIPSVTHIQDRQSKLALGARERFGTFTTHCGESWTQEKNPAAPSLSDNLIGVRATKLTELSAPLCEDCLAVARKTFAPALFKGLPDA